ncbi:hypothetical protein C5C33_03495, partial [Rathayibacter sp. AY1H3]
MLPALACPVCGGALAPDALPRPSSLRCPLGHSADLARQGYASLLRGRHATSGDTAAMVQARADLLGSGHYRVIQDAVAAAVPAGARLVVDLGCGTGAYLAAVLEAHPAADGLGLDLSAPAARRAARAHPRAAIATADLWQPLPLADASAAASRASSASGSTWWALGPISTSARSSSTLISTVVSSSVRSSSANPASCSSSRSALPASMPSIPNRSRISCRCLSRGVTTTATPPGRSTRRISGAFRGAKTVSRASAEASASGRGCQRSAVAIAARGCARAARRAAGA